MFDRIRSIRLERGAHSVTKAISGREDQSRTERASVGIRSLYSSCVVGRTRSWARVAQLLLVCFATVAFAAFNPVGAHAAAPPGCGVSGCTQIGVAPLLPSGTVPLGPMAPTSKLTLLILLRPSNPTALEDEVQAVSTPTSPSYKHFLRKGQFGKEFGATSSTISEVKKALAGVGLKSIRVDSSHLQISVTSRVGSTENALHVDLESYLLPDGRHVFANTRAPSVRSAVSPYIDGILGLDDVETSQPVVDTNGHTPPVSRQVPKLDASSVTACGVGPVFISDGQTTLNSNVLTSPFQANFQPSDLGESIRGVDIGANAFVSQYVSTTQVLMSVPAIASGTSESIGLSGTLALGTGGAVPSDLANTYGLTHFYAPGDQGNGTTVALFELAAFDKFDISDYQMCYKTAVNVSTVRILLPLFPAPNCCDSGTDEVTSDIEDVIGLAPLAKIEVYEASNSLWASWGAELQRIADDDTAQVVSISWEMSCGDNPYTSALDAKFQQMAAQGQSVFAASGDNGSEDCGGTGDSVGFPASDPNVTSVGGTQWNGGPSGETTWNGGCDTPCGGGGGNSSWIMPWYQTGLGVQSSHSSQSCGSGKSFCREVPDVSALASPSVPGYSIDCSPLDCRDRTFQGGWGRIGGTSLASPTWASVAALMDSRLVLAGAKPLGFLNPLFYSHPNLLHDITSGDNNLINPNPPADFPATVGYDMATGLGSPNGELICDFVGVCQPLRINSCCTLATVGQPFDEVVGAVGGAPPYSSWAFVGAPPKGLRFDPTGSICGSPGSICGTPQQPGDTSFTISVQDALGDSASTNASISVAASPVNMTVSDSPAQWSEVLQPVTLTATLSVTPDAGQVQFFKDGASFGSPICVGTSGACPLGSTPSSACSNTQTTCVANVTWTPSIAEVGDHQINAQYIGDTNYKGVLSFPFPHTVYSPGVPVVRTPPGCAATVSATWFGTQDVPIAGDSIAFDFDNGPLDEAPTSPAQPEQAGVVEAARSVSLTGAHSVTIVDMAPGTSVKSHTTQVHLFVNPACRVKPEAPSFTDVFVHRVGQDHSRSMCCRTSIPMGSSTLTRRPSRS